MIINCTNCNKEFNKAPSEIKKSKSGNHFCSKSCSATYNNKIKPKRKPTRVCSKLNCTNTVAHYRTTLCISCLEYQKEFQYKDKTIGEYRNKQSIKGKHPSWTNAHIRQFARSWLKYLTKKPCAKCGYSKHVELCHIKAVSDFEDSALLKEVNSEKNVIQLCRNCHWEFDNLDRKEFDALVH